MQLQSLGQEDPLEEETATPSSILAWGLPWTKEPGGLQSMGSQRLQHDWSDCARTYACCLSNAKAEKRIGRVGKLIIPILTKAFNPSKFKTFLLVKLITLE